MTNDAVGDCGCAESGEPDCKCICPRCEEWVHEEDHQNKEFANGVCSHCTCDDCGKRIETDDMNDDSCEPCMDIAMARFDARDAEGWCNDCDEEKAVQHYVNEDGMGMNLCVTCLDSAMKVDRAWVEFRERHGRRPNLAEYVHFGLELEGEDFDSSMKDLV